VYVASILVSTYTTEKILSAISLANTFEKCVHSDLINRPFVIDYLSVCVYSVVVHTQDAADNYVHSYHVHSTCTIGNTSSSSVCCMHGDVPLVLFFEMQHRL
jgi:hypothetical protein